MAYDTKGQIATGLIIGSERGADMLLDILAYYENHNFIKANGFVDTTTVVSIVSNILEDAGIPLDGKYRKTTEFTLFPAEYFDPFDYEQKSLQITNKTYSIHHYAASWKTKKEMLIWKIGFLVRKIVGKKVYTSLARLKHLIIG